MLVTLAVFAGIGLAAYFNRAPTPDPGELRDSAKKERQITSLKRELETLTAELERVRRDYSLLVAERRCEIIDGMDDCLAAGLQRPARFRESDLELVSRRQAEVARKEAQNMAETAAQNTAKPANAGQDKTMMESMVNLLKSIPGVKID